MTPRRSLWDLAGIFLRLGLTAFGGPAAHIAMMRQEFVAKRGWLTEEEYLDLVGASNLIPGPSSTEVAIHLGLRRAGWAGLALAGVCFILPAALLVSALAWAYAHYGHLPEAGRVFRGIKPVIAQALWMLGRAALKTRPLAVLALAALGAGALGAPPLAVLLGTGLLAALCDGAKRGPSPSPHPPLGLIGAAGVLLGLPTLFTLASAPARSATPGSLFWVFAKIGSAIYGSGYVLLAFLKTELVTRRHWLTTGQLLDAVAVGQFTPGPVFTTATFIGYLAAGPWGAFAATVGIFLPAFLFVAVSGPVLPKIRRSPTASAMLDGVNAASLALMALVTGQLARAALIDVPTVLIALASAFLLIRWRVNSAWLVLGGAAAGVLLPS